MTIRHEIKSQLAKLLATEDLVVEHKKCDTAQFNVHTRVLTLPMWEKASNTVYDLLVGHEVGHALYTPNDNWYEEYNIPTQFVNVVEDARIEKLMKRRYPGICKTFYKGYKELSDQDFFSIKNENIDKLNLADRANLYFKIGNYIDLKFSYDEQKIIDLITCAETFLDVLDAAQKLYEYCQQQANKKIEDIQNNFDSNDQNLENSDNENSNQSGRENEDELESNETLDDKKSSKQKDQNFDNGFNNDQNNLEIKTMESFQDSIKNLVNNSSFENVYLEIPELNLDNIIIPNNELHTKIKNTWDNYSEEYFELIDKKFVEFKRYSQKEVNYLVKEFECKKAADSYCRSSISRTGILDCSKLHSYKYSEDLFKKVTTVSDGKNHGLVFILDWSGSMSDVMLDTVKQLFNLIWFCKKVSIPFEVYAFTCDYPLVKYDENHKAIMRTLSHEKKPGFIQVGEWFSLMNLFTSKVNSRVLENQMKNIFRVASAFSIPESYEIPSFLTLSGTPLNETLIALHQILPKFKKEYKLQKVQCVILTDGEAPVLKYYREMTNFWDKNENDTPKIGLSTIGPNAFLRDRKTGNTYSFDCEWHRFTDIFLRNLRDKFKDINFIGIRVIESRDAGSFIRLYSGWGENSDYAKVISSWKKNKSFTIKKSGYHSYFGISSSILSQSAEFDVHECASKSQIKSAFMKSLKNKKMNKKILSEFIELVA